MPHRRTASGLEGQEASEGQGRAAVQANAPGDARVTGVQRADDDVARSGLRGLDVAGQNGQNTGMKITPKAQKMRFNGRPTFTKSVNL